MKSSVQKNVNEISNILLLPPHFSSRSVALMIHIKGEKRLKEKKNRTQKKHAVAH